VKRTLAVLTMAASMLAPAAAPARDAPKDSNPVVEATARAQAYWHTVPCGQVPIVAAPEIPAGAPADVAMWTNLVSAFESPPSCPIYVNAKMWPSWRIDDEHFELFCKLMVHEYGHLEGYADANATPGTVEYIDPAQAVVPLCEQFRLVYFEAGRTRVFASASTVVQTRVGPAAAPHRRTPPIAAP
jgi:hypothetical protein